MDGTSMLSRSFTREIDSNAGIAGIGLLMQQDLDPSSEDTASRNKVFIKSVVPGGACDRDSTIRVGDVVLSANGENVVGMGVSEIRERIVGPIGSEVVVGLESGATGTVYERTLTRGNASAQTGVSAGSVPPPNATGVSAGSLPPPNATALSHSMDARVQLSRSMNGRSMDTFSLPMGALSNDLVMQRQERRIRELESQLNWTTEEYNRVKMLLESDRNNSEKTVKEIDVIQRKNTQQLFDLKGMLNKSEQARRDLEIQLSNSKAREEEFHLAFSRAKEQTEAREQYFVELKEQLDEVRSAYETDLAQANEEKNDLQRKLMKSEEDKEKLRAELKAVKSKELERREKELTVKQMLQETEHKMISLKQLEEKLRGQSQALHLLFGQWHKDYFMNKSPEELELEQYFLA